MHIFNGSINSIKINITDEFLSYEKNLMNLNSSYKGGISMTILIPYTKSLELRAPSH